MIVLGKTHTVEFAMGSFGTNTHLGTPWNRGISPCIARPAALRADPRSPSRQDWRPFAIGTDTGGSVRLPAAWCGIVGLKVTLGRISTHGVLPLAFYAGHAGTDGALRRRRRADLPRAERSGCERRGRRSPLTPLDPMPTLAPRCGAACGWPCCRTRSVWASMRTMLAAYDASVKTLADLGAEIVRVTLPNRFSDYAAGVGRIIGAEG
jgi:aspartyl-tRNA(Asn)/glutamyl-tRNA(Gln) amidotransferase subunit A